MPTRSDSLSSDPDDGPFDLGSIDVGDERPTHGLSDDRRGATMLALVVTGGALGLALVVAWLRGDPAQDEAPAHTAPFAAPVSAAEPVVDAPPVPLEEPAPREALTASDVLATRSEGAVPSNAPSPATSDPSEREPEARAPSPRVMPAVPDAASPSITEPAAEQPFADLPSIDAERPEASAAADTREAFTPDDAASEAPSEGVARDVAGHADDAPIEGVAPGGGPPPARGEPSGEHPV